MLERVSGLGGGNGEVVGVGHVRSERGQRVR